MSEATELTGPDLRAGVPLSALREGELFAGHADGEAVLVVRRGAEVHAIGGTCTHYGGPLVEGLLSDGVVRCPWHHACFSIHTGEAVAAPALNSLPRWLVRIENDTFFVIAKEESDALSARGRAAKGPSSVVIVGAGAAGSAAAEMLRREGYTGPISLIDPDEDAPYDRPNLSKDFLAGNAPEEWIPLRPPGFHAAHGIDRIDAAVTGIDTRQKRVTLSHGGELEYGALLLATGAAPIRPRLPGADLAHVHVLRSLADCRRLIDAAKAGRRILIAGASFIGLEAAAALRNRGMDVCVVAPERVPFEHTLGEDLGAMIWSLHEQNGVEFELGHALSEIHEHAVVLDDGTEIECDVVLLGVGVRPLLDLAQRAGLAEDRGVPVDEFLETRVRGVFAAGDIALYPDPRTGESIRVEHWVVAQRQGQTAARNMLGMAQRFDSVPFFWTQQFGLSVSYTGHTKTWDEVRIEGDASSHDCSISYVRNGAVAAVATVNRDRAALEAELMLEQAARAPATSNGGRGMHVDHG